MAKHFLTLNDYPADELMQIIQRAMALKKDPSQYHSLKNKVLILLFEKQSTRTRVAFEVAMAKLDGTSLFLSPRDTQVGRGEPIEDTARVLSRMADVVVLRTFTHETQLKFAEYSSVPVINGLSDRFHPCQLMADIQTYLEHRGQLAGKTVAWIGDGNNMCHSYINAAKLFDFKLNICTPKHYAPLADIVKHGKSHIELFEEPLQAARDVDLIVTDVWSSMGHESEQDKRKVAFRHFQVNKSILKKAKPDALFMHCLPAHRGEEVSTDVIDGPQSVVWDEAENRMHVQRALLEHLVK